TIEAVSPAGCVSASRQVIVTVSPVPSVSASDQTICSGEEVTINLTNAPNNVSGTTYAWLAIPSANVIGAANGDGSVIKQTLSTSDANVGIVTYRITPTANNCDGLPVDVVVTVNPIATVDAGINFAVCEPSEINIIGFIGGSASTGTWTVVTGAGNIIPGLITPVAGGFNVSAVYEVASSDIATDVVLRLETNDTDGTGPCAAVFDLLTISINRSATVTLPADYVVCEPQSILLTGTIGGSATAGIWSVSTGTGTLTSSSITGNTITATYFPSADDINSIVTFMLSSNDPDGFGPCTVVEDEINITINEAARVSAGPDISICEDSPSVLIQGSIAGSTSTVTWSGGAGLLDNINAVTPVYEFSNPAENGTQIRLTVVAEDPDGSGPCTSVSDQMVLTINRLPEVIFSGLPPNSPPFPPAVAENTLPSELIGNRAGGLFTIAPALGLGSTFINVVDRVIFDPSAATLGSNFITYTFTDINGCTNSNTQEVVVNPVTVVDFSVQGSVQDEFGNFIICGDQGLIQLIGNPPASSGKTPITTFTGLSAEIDSKIVRVGNEFYIDTDGLASGSYQIDYIYQNEFDAITFRRRGIIVYATAIAAINVDNSCISEAIRFNDASTFPAFPPALQTEIAQWNWQFDDGAFSALQNPDHIYNNARVYNVVLNVVTDRGCRSSASLPIRVGDVPIVNFEWSGVCNNDATAFEDKTDPGSISIIETYRWDFGDGYSVEGPANGTIPSDENFGRTTGTFKDPAHKYDEFQSYTVRLSVTTNDGCNNSEENIIFILPYTTITPTIGVEYFEDFEADDAGGWIREDIPNRFLQPNGSSIIVRGDTSWIHGIPNGEHINALNSDGKVWWTGANNSSYYMNEKSVVNGPCFNLTELQRPMISIDYWVDAQDRFDGAVVQYSVNGGLTWLNIGSANITDGLNWYNGANIVSQPGTSTSNPFGFGWTGRSNGWRTGRFSLDQIPTTDPINPLKNPREQVRIRVAFGSDPNNPPGEIFDGFAFDNVFVGDKKRTVLVEHFTNLNDPNSQVADNRIEQWRQQGIAKRGLSDFNTVQYHLGIPNSDEINRDNPADPAARSVLYGIPTSPRTFIDGIVDPPRFNGIISDIFEVDIERQAMIDPEFDIEVTALDAPEDQVSLEVLVRARTTVTNSVAIHAALIQKDVVVNSITNRNVLRKLLFGTTGRVATINWIEGTELTVLEQNIPHGIVSRTQDVQNNLDNLAVVVFVQDRITRRIYQSKQIDITGKREIRPVGVEDFMQTELEKISIYPNPASRVMNIGIDDLLAYEYQWKLIDQRGVEVLNGDLNLHESLNQQVDISKLPNGIYHLVIGHINRPLVRRKVAVMNRGVN
ncbi:MAG TPA: PKD domain-containing protein, partial [Cyclobacteriaceae bacterium]|nr:PKD domain-containing protein [Cyclobacteriaceae bacterium]